MPLVSGRKSYFCIYVGGTPSRLNVRYFPNSETTTYRKPLNPLTLALEMGSVRISVCEAERDFSTVPPPAPLRPGASGAVGKSVIILPAGGFKAFGVEDGELVHRLLPVFGGPSPVGGDVAQG